MSDPYNSIGRQYDAEVFMRAMSPVLQSMNAALFKAIHRVQSQQLTPGYDPYNSGAPSVVLIVHDEVIFPLSPTTPRKT